MSRIGKKPVELPKGVSLTTAIRTITVKGPKGELHYEHRPEVKVSVEGSRVNIENLRPARDATARAYHGLTRALVQNMVVGVTTGYERKLEIEGVGYQVKKSGAKLVFSLGFANEIPVEVPAGVQVDVTSPTALIIRGCDKQAVGQLAAQIRKLRKPEPYKGKGIRYEGEVIKRKAGKAFGSS